MKAIVLKNRDFVDYIYSELEGENGFSARLRTDMGGLREYNGMTLEEVLNEVILELQEEFSP